MSISFIPKDWSRVHHAHIVCGADIGAIWRALADNLSFKKQANPDAYSEEYETFGIDEARTLSEWAIMKPIAAERKVAVISTLSFTVEAQNALLKLFEEPPAGTYFFIIVPNTGSILPTLLSRVRVISLREENEADNKLEKFLQSSISERLQMIAPLIKSKDKERARNFIKALEQKINAVSTEQKLQSAKKILEAEKYGEARGASLKIILEHLAVSLPNSA
jgi:DNA polymerase III gamma/tau subunit